MKQRLERLCRRLQQDGVCLRPFVMIGYALLWICPDNWTYRDVMDVYADYIDDAPERVHANLCRYILRAGFDIGPADYFTKVREEVERIEDRVSVKSGG